MFGDIRYNSMNWPLLTIEQVCSSIVRGPFGSSLKKDIFVPKGKDTVKVYEQKHAIQKSWTIGSYYIPASKAQELARFECKPGDFIMSCSGTMGELYQLPESSEPGIINQALCKFTLNDVVIPRYFLSVMNELVGNLISHGSAISNLASVRYLKEMKIPVPPLSYQRNFVDFLEQVDKSKLLFQQMVSKYDELVKSRFNEILNDELLAITELKNLITQDQTTEKIDNPEKEIFVTLQSRGKGAKQREITEGKTPVKFTGYRIKAGQFIYSRIDARNGAFDIVPTSLDGAVVSKDFPVFEIDSEKVNPVFLLSSVLQPSFIQQIQSNSFGATNRQRIKEDVLLKYMIKMPSMEIQNQFADFVRQVDKSKFILSRIAELLGLSTDSVCLPVQALL